VCEKVGEQIWPNYALEVFAVLEENINSLVLTYSPGVCVFPAHSGFTPGWVYVHVGGGAVCLINLLYWALVLLEFVVCCTVLVDLTVRTLYHSVGNVICYFVYHCLLKKLWYIIVKFFTGILAAYRLPNMVCLSY